MRSLTRGVSVESQASAWDQNGTLLLRRIATWTGSRAAEKLDDIAHLEVIV